MKNGLLTSQPQPHSLNLNLNLNLNKTNSTKRTKQFATMKPNAGRAKKAFVQFLKNLIIPGAIAFTFLTGAVQVLSKQMLKAVTANTNIIADS